MVKLRSYFLKCNSIKSMRIGLRCTLAMSSSCFGSNIKTTNGKSREQWGHEVCSSNMYPMLSDIENWWGWAWLSFYLDVLLYVYIYFVEESISLLYLTQT